MEHGLSKPRISACSLKQRGSYASVCLMCLMCYCTHGRQRGPQEARGCAHVAKAYMHGHCYMPCIMLSPPRPIHVGAPWPRLHDPRAFCWSGRHWTRG